MYPPDRPRSRSLAPIGAWLPGYTEHTIYTAHWPPLCGMEAPPPTCERVPTPGVSHSTPAPARGHSGGLTGASQGLPEARTGSASVESVGRTRALVGLTLCNLRFRALEWSRARTTSVRRCAAALRSPEPPPGATGPPSPPLGGPGSGLTVRKTFSKRSAACHPKPRKITKKQSQTLNIDHAASVRDTEPVTERAHHARGPGPNAPACACVPLHPCGLSVACAKLCLSAFLRQCLDDLYAQLGRARCVPGSL